MAARRITDLPGAGTLDGTEAIPLDQGAGGSEITVKASPAAIGALGIDAISLSLDSQGRLQATVSRPAAADLTSNNLALPGGLAAVTSDNSLTGDGTTANQLEVANPFSDADETKLDGIETGATADQTDAEIVDAVDTELGGTTWQGGGGGGSFMLPAPTIDTVTLANGSFAATNVDKPAAGALLINVVAANNYAASATVSMALLDLVAAGVDTGVVALGTNALAFPLGHSRRLYVGYVTGGAILLGTNNGDSVGTANVEITVLPVASP